MKDLRLGPICNAEIQEPGLPARGCRSRAIVRVRTRNGTFLYYCNAHKSRIAEAPNRHNAGVVERWALSL